MKKIILSLLILILSSVCFGRETVQSNKVGSEYKYQIGYTTKYGNSFGQSTYNYQQTYSSTTRPTGNIRRSAARPYSGGAFEDFVDWLRMTTDHNWPDYVDEDYWEEFLQAYPEYENEAREWFESQGRRFPADPDDPFADPIGSEFVLLIFLIIWCVYKYGTRRTT